MLQQLHNFTEFSPQEATIYNSTSLFQEKFFLQFTLHIRCNFSLTLPVIIVGEPLKIL